METVQTSHGKAEKPAATNGSKLVPKIAKNIYCVLCRRRYLKHEAQAHVHGMLHHRELETVLGKDSFHECHACKVFSMGLNEYAQHISTAQHKARLKSLKSKNAKPVSLLKTLSTEVIARILQRNKTLRREEKKETRKKKKKLKEIAKQKRWEKKQRAIQRAAAARQVTAETLNGVQETHQKGSVEAVVQNTENEASAPERPPDLGETALQSPGGGAAGSAGEPAGRTWCQACVQVRLTQSAPRQVWCDDDTQEGAAADTPVQMAWPVISQCQSSEFTSDHLPLKGAIIFDQVLTGPSQPGQEGSRRSANPAPEDGSGGAAPTRDVNVGSMLREIRRVLGVREPCRADREARKQSGGAGARAADRSAAQRPATEKERPPGAATTSAPSLQVGAHVRVAHPGACPSSASPAKSKQTSVTLTKEATQHCKKSLAAADELSNSREGESQGALEGPTSPSRCAVKTTPTEPNPNIAHKVRIAHKSSKTPAAGLTLSLNRLLTLSGAKSQLSWGEMYEQMKRKKLDKVKGMPRFGIEFMAPLMDEESSTLPQDEDLPLSEGFHWESVPGSPSGPRLTLPPPPGDTTHAGSHGDTQPDSQVQEPGPAQRSGSARTVTAAPVKAEPDLKEESADSRDGSSGNKRKQSTETHDVVSDKEQSGKKKKTKSNKVEQNRMDELLAVSLREDELSHSLQDLDKSLVQARNALQAAYAEVQGLLLLRQQFTAEVDTLRTKRIEILQGMQEGYVGASHAAEKATPSTSAAAAAVQPRRSPLPSCSASATSTSQHTPAKVSSPSVPRPHPTPLALPATSQKQEISHPPTAGQARQAVSSNAAAPPNQPVPLFPSDPLVPAASLPANTCVCPGSSARQQQHDKKEGSKDCIKAARAAVAETVIIKSDSEESLLSCVCPGSSARQQQHDKKEGSKDCIKAARAAQGETVIIKSDSEEETGGDLGQQERLKGRQTAAAEKPVPKKGRSTAAAAPDGSEGGKLTGPSHLEVIDIDESDDEDSNVPARPEPPQRPVSVEFSSASTQTSDRNMEDRNVKVPLPVTDANISVESVEDKELALGAFMSHMGPVNGLQVHGGLLYTCSGDNTARAYSLVSRECLAVFKGHSNRVNCLLVSSLPNMPLRLYTGSSDRTIRCYSIRTKRFLERISLLDRVLCLHIAWDILYAGLANGYVAGYDLKTMKQQNILCFGPRGVSCLGAAQEGARRVLLVGSYDSTISVRDAKSGLLLRSLEGHTKTVLCMKVVNDLVFSGSSDTSVHAHNIHTGELVRIYKGHGHAVTSVVILGKVMVTASLDKLVRVYELESHDRLQVYGGQSDKVLCMAVHKSVIYTGCYDGSVQAVKLNLMNNHRCWWQNCSLIFGVAEHLVHHLVRDHSNPSLQVVKCCWRGCGALFATQQLVQQQLPEHMRSHAESGDVVPP